MILTVPRSPARVKRLARLRVRSAGRRGRSAIVAALRGEAKPRVSPRAAEVKFISHHAFALIAGSVLAAIAIGALVLALLLLFDAARFRRPQSWAPARPLVSELPRPG